MNRLNTNNMVEDITKNFQIQVSEPYLLYRNKIGEINGIWFYNVGEGENISQFIQKLVKSLGSNTQSPNNSTINVQPTKLQQLFANPLLYQYAPQQQPLTKEQFKNSLLNLLQDDQFIDLVYTEYIKFTTA